MYCLLCCIVCINRDDDGDNDDDFISFYVWTLVSNVKHIQICFIFVRSGFKAKFNVFNATFLSVGDSFPSLQEH